MQKEVAVSVESDESVPEEGLMADVRHVGHKEELLELTWVLILWVGLRMSQTVVENSLFIFVFPSNG